MTTVFLTWQVLNAEICTRNIKIDLCEIQISRSVHENNNNNNKKRPKKQQIPDVTGVACIDNQGMMDGNQTDKHEEYAIYIMTVRHVLW